MVYSNPRRTRDTHGLINEVISSHNSPLWKNRVSILVEGKDDENIYAELFNDKTTKIFTSNGFNQLEKALEALNARFDDTIGIRDADYCHLTGRYSTIKNLFFTDCHDIEMTILHAESLLFTVVTKYDKQENINVIWDESVKIASFVGYIRWYYQNNKIDTSTKLKLFSNDGININNWSEQKIINKVNSKMPMPIKSEDITPFINQNKTEDIFNLCNGHDMIILITLGLKVNKSGFLNDITAVFKKSGFKETKLYHDLLSWQNNTSYILFAGNSTDTDYYGTPSS
jgi:hypothetical protein